MDLLIFYPFFFIFIFIFLELREDELRDSTGIGADDLALLMAVFEGEDCGHGGDAELLAQFGEMVDVDLAEEDVLVLFLLGQPDQKRGDDLTRPAPSGEGIDDDDLV
jgi:hypothetical protein